MTRSFSAKCLLTLGWVLILLGHTHTNQAQDTTRSDAAPLIVVANSDCEVTLDGKRIGQLKANVPQTFLVGLGQHLLLATASDGRLSKKIIDVTSATQLVADLEFLQESRFREGPEEGADSAADTNKPDATVYIIRRGGRGAKTDGGGWGQTPPDITVDGPRLVTRLGWSRYFVARLRPGLRHLAAQGAGYSCSYELQVNSGSEYYVRFVKELRGVMVPRDFCRLERISGEEGMAEIRKAKPIDAKSVLDRTMVIVP